MVQCTCMLFIHIQRHGILLRYKQLFFCFRLFRSCIIRRQLIFISPQHREGKIGQFLQHNNFSFAGESIYYQYCTCYSTTCHHQTEIRLLFFHKRKSRLDCYFSSEENQDHQILLHGDSQWPATHGQSTQHEHDTKTHAT